MNAQCAGPDCVRPTYAKSLCFAHYNYARRHPRRKLRPLSSNETALRLSVEECSQLLRMAKRKKLTLHELVKRIATVGVGG